MLTCGVAGTPLAMVSGDLLMQCLGCGLDRPDAEPAGKPLSTVGEVELSFPTAEPCPRCGNKHARFAMTTHDGDETPQEGEPPA